MKSLTLQRIAAVDVFRALTMFLMLFVNDIPGLKNVPHWLMHARMDEDMMGFSDTIFPAFLFCMGMSVSFAIQNRYKKGDNTLQVVAHIFWRTVALIAMGLFSLNSGGIEGGLSHPWFSILMVIGFFLTWGVYPKAVGTKKVLFTAMKTAGVPDKLVGHPRTYRLDVCGMCRHLSIHSGEPAEECHCLVRGRIACRNQPFRPDTGRVRQPDYPASLYPE